MATDDVEPPLGDGGHRTAATHTPETDESAEDVTYRARLQRVRERVGPVEFVFAGLVLASAVGTLAGLLELFTARVLIVLGFSGVFGSLLLGTVILVTVGGDYDANTDESDGSPYDWSTTDRPRVRRRP